MVVEPVPPRSSHPRLLLQRRVRPGHHRSRGHRHPGFADEFGRRRSRCAHGVSATEYAFEGGELTRSEGQRLRSPARWLPAWRVGPRTSTPTARLRSTSCMTYTYRRVRDTTPGQAPMKWSFGVEGSLTIARSSRPAALPAQVLDDLTSDRVVLRLEAVKALAQILRTGKPAQRAASAAALTGLREHDDSLQVRQAAAGVVGPLAPSQAQPEALRQTERPVAAPPPLPAPVRAGPEPAPAPVPVAEQVPASSPVATAGPAAVPHRGVNPSGRRAVPVIPTAGITLTRGAAPMIVAAWPCPQRRAGSRWAFNGRSRKNCRLAHLLRGGVRPRRSSRPDWSLGRVPGRRARLGASAAIHRRPRRGTKRGVRLGSSTPPAASRRPSH